MFQMRSVWHSGPFAAEMTLQLKRLSREARLWYGVKTFTLKRLIGSFLTSRFYKKVEADSTLINNDIVARVINDEIANHRLP